MSKIIKACIFDLGGTLVDSYSLTPIVSLKYLFRKHRIELPNNLIIDHMELHKRDHISLILNDKEISYQWLQEKGTEYSQGDIDKLYTYFKCIQGKYTKEHMKIIPQTWNCINTLKEMGIKSCVTTGFDKEQTNLVKQILEGREVHIDHYVSSLCIDKPGRPHPYMIHEIMDRLDIEDENTVLKVDDTNIGIQEGLNAGCWTVGVYRWSVYMGIMNDIEANQIDNVIIDNYNDNYYQLSKKKIISKNRLGLSGAHYVVPTVGYIPNIIQNINNMDTPLPKLNK